MAKTKVLICPYCGEPQPAGGRCRSCGGLFEPLSRQATQNAMGPWYVRNPDRPFQPGCSYETLVRLIERGQVQKNTIIRGPTTKQFWTVARRVPGLAHLFGYCHECETHVEETNHGCASCGASFGAYLDRNNLGLSDVNPMPWDADLEDGVAPSASMLMTPAAGGGRLSSFATDEELLGESTLRKNGPNGPSSPPRSTPTPIAPAPIDSSAGSHGGSDEHPVTSPAARAMQRRLASQHRTIRTLTVILLVAVVLLLTVSIPLAASLFSPDEKPSPPPAEPVTASPAETPSIPGSASVSEPSVTGVAAPEVPVDP
ncbi:MAG: hypothetical protein ACYTGC_04335, partial [Planctomycetota bacterium]